ncbi:MAG: DUF1700 domain-containing protein [Pygmaiobacter sp.]|jgi:uncharacterized membrane protein|nr:DUF1700 domain-containing protein [Pygmaiobacter sp.]
MTKREFLEALNDELLPLSEDERSAAIKYYSDYIDDAGEENLAAVLEELGSPSQVAASIKADAEIGRNVPPQPKQAAQQAAPKPMRNGMSAWGIVLLIVLSPVWIPLIAAAGGVILGLFGAFIGLLISGVVMVLVAIALIIIGIITMLETPMVGLLLIGVGMLIAGVGALMVLVSVFLCATVIPAMVRGLVRIFRRPARQSGTA